MLHGEQSTGNWCMFNFEESEYTHNKASEEQCKTLRQTSG